MTGQGQFNPEMLVLAREAQEWKQTELSKLVGVNQATISKLESGMLEPSDALVSDLAKTLRLPVTFFYQMDRVYGFNSTVFFHRKRQSLSDTLLRKLHAYMNITRMRTVRLLRSVAMESPCKFRQMNPAEYQGGVTGAAKLVRSSWLLPPGPVKNVTETIEESGGIVVKIDFGTRMADAVSEWIPGFPPIFLVNSHSDISGDRYRLTLAHEVGHIFLHTDGIPTPELESEANEFAAELMMPRREIKSSLYGLNMGKLADLKRQWKVSMAALIQRAYDLGLLTEHQRRYMFINVVKKTGSRLHEPLEDEMPREEPALFNRLVRVHLNELGYSPSEMATLLFYEDEDKFRNDFMGERKLRLV